MSETYKSDMSVPSTSHYKYMESEFCTGVSDHIRCIVGDVRNTAEFYCVSAFLAAKKTLDELIYYLVQTERVFV